jgi:predicted transcriptional regulator
LEDFPHGLSIEEIARLEGITEAEVKEILETAIKKARLNIGAFMKKL